MKDYENTINSIQDLINAYRFELEENKEQIETYKKIENYYMVDTLLTENKILERIIKDLEKYL